jgi:two-component system KDP operon response regulator KdpE
MGQLRAKLEDEPAAPRCLLTEPGVGYRIVEGDEAGASGG